MATPSPVHEAQSSNNWTYLGFLGSKIGTIASYTKDKVVQVVKAATSTVASAAVSSGSYLWQTLPGAKQVTTFSTQLFAEKLLPKADVLDQDIEAAREQLRKQTGAGATCTETCRILAASATQYLKHEILRAKEIERGTGVQVGVSWLPMLLFEGKGKTEYGCLGQIMQILLEKNAVLVEAKTHISGGSGENRAEEVDKKAKQFINRVTSFLLKIGFPNGAGDLKLDHLPLASYFSGWLMSSLETSILPQVLNQAYEGILHPYNRELWINMALKQVPALLTGSQEATAAPRQESQKGKSPAQNAPLAFATSCSDCLTACAHALNPALDPLLQNKTVQKGIATASNALYDQLKTISLGDIAEKGLDQALHALQPEGDWNADHSHFNDKETHYFTKKEALLAYNKTWEEKRQALAQENEKLVGNFLEKAVDTIASEKVGPRGKEAIKKLPPKIQGLATAVHQCLYGSVRFVIVTAIKLKLKGVQKEIKPAVKRAYDSIAKKSLQESFMPMQDLLERRITKGPPNKKK